MAQLHLICGLPGAGKTTLARRLEGELPGLRLSPDEWLIRIIGPKLSADGTSNGPFRDAVEGIQFELGLRLVAEGLNIVFVSRQLGHATPSFTLNVYSHLFDRAEHARRATDALEAGFSSILVQ
jgi:integrase